LTELRAGSATDVGRVREINQDQFLVAPPLFAVADGMGGAAGGEVASGTAIEHLRDAFVAGGEATPENLVEAAQAANRAVWDQAEANPEMRGMGTTLVALAQVADGRVAAINIGDSRLYVQRHGELQQVSSDHNLVSELVAEGRLSKEEAEFHPRRNIITRALGVEPEVPVDQFLLDAGPGDRFLLCSDGLFRELSDGRISSILSRLADPEEAARELVNEAYLLGGNDNITVVVVDVAAPSEEEVAAPAEEKDEALTTAMPVVVAPEVAEEPPEPRQVRRRWGRRRTRPATGGHGLVCPGRVFRGLAREADHHLSRAPGRVVVVPPDGRGRHQRDHGPDRGLSRTGPHGRPGGAHAGRVPPVRPVDGGRRAGSPSGDQTARASPQYAGEDHTHDPTPYHHHRMSLMSTRPRSAATS
jgi:serine/threonine protein phosphatase PrpC